MIKYYDPQIIDRWSDENRHKIWRYLWYKLAKCQKELGVDISDEQIIAFENATINPISDTLYDIEYKKTNHDVVAMMRTVAHQYPIIADIIHLGATSSFVTDNSEAIILHDCLHDITKELKQLLTQILHKIERYQAAKCMGYTHFQHAQVTTIGKRFAAWARGLEVGLDSLEFAISQVKLRGAKGAVGTQLTFQTLLGERTGELDDLLAKEIGISVDDICTQTYNRAIDVTVMNAMSVIASAISKICLDIRLLSNVGELREHFGSEQVGSSAMPHKKEPRFLQSNYLV